MIDAPCKDCKERQVGCHSKCEKYAEFYRQNEDRKAKKWFEQRTRYIPHSYSVRNKNKLK